MSTIGISLALIFSVALYWGAKRIIEQDREKVGLNFFAMTTFLNSQERYLSHLRARSHEFHAGIFERPPEAVELISSPSEPVAMYKVQAAMADVPYSILCEHVDLELCPSRHRSKDMRTPLFSLGDYLSDAFAAHWARSYFPGARTILLGEGDQFALVVPTLETATEADFRHASIGLEMIDQLREFIKQNPDISVFPKPVHWMRLKDIKSVVAGVIELNFPPEVQSLGRPGRQTRMYVFTVSSLDKAEVFRNIIDTPIYEDFWLLHGSGTVLAGEAPLPKVSKVPGVSMDREGVIFSFSDNDSWSGHFRVSYRSLFQANLWLPGMVVGGLLVFLLGVLLYVRWYNRKVIGPAEQAQQALVDSESFNRTLLETAPVALCVFTLDDAQVVFSNALAQQWLDLHPEENAFYVPPDLLPHSVLRARSPGTLDIITIHGRNLQLVYAPTRFRKQAVVLCVFSDISARVQMEEALSVAKAEAVSANAAKSRFLAAVSHEIRTPLYGILGTMELMSLGKLEEGQREHLLRLQQSAAVLMQLISDILDVTKIEADQLALNVQKFNPRLLLQSCADSYAAAAAQKKLLLFACVDTNVPQGVLGDQGRIRQILNNFVSNSLKFTQSGQIVLRLHANTQTPGQVELSFQVSDTGVGISAAEQSRLFTPFYQVETIPGMTQGGTGLGLSICDNLSKLMGGDIRVTSEPGLGSSFSLKITVPTEPLEQETPVLPTSPIVIRSPHAELSQTLCAWLRQWGGQAQVWEENQTDKHLPETLFLDVLPTQVGLPEGWNGLYVQAGLQRHPDQASELFIQGYSPDELARGVLRILHGKSPSPSPLAEDHGYTSLNLHVLVAEDNPINQATLGEQLQQLGCTSRIVNDGAEALEYWSAESFDVVLTDVNMPNMNGYELAQALRQQGVKVPIMGVTANAMRDEEQRCYAAGMSDWLVKPIDLTSLYTHLSRLFPNRKSADNAENHTVQANEPASQAVDPEPVQAAQPSARFLLALAEQALVPERHHKLYKDSMSADAQDLQQAAQDSDEAALRRGLHRLLGALLAMKQSVFAAAVEEIQTLIHDNDLETAVQKTNVLVQELNAAIAEINP